MSSDPFYFSCLAFDEPAAASDPSDAASVMRSGKRAGRRGWGQKQEVSPAELKPSEFSFALSIFKTLPKSSIDII